MLKGALEECNEKTSCIKRYFSKIKDWNGETATFSFQSNGDPVINSWREQRIVNGEEVYETID